jgi:hypothetical protein
LAGRYKVNTDEVGIYVKDSYDFKNIPGNVQELGNWDFGDDCVGRTTFDGGETVRNSDFRKWRTTNSKGGGCFIYSDISYIKRTPSDVFCFQND